MGTAERAASTLPADDGVWGRLEAIETAAVIVRGEAVDRGRALEALVEEAAVGIDAIRRILAHIAKRTDVPRDIRDALAPIVAAGGTPDAQ